MEGQKYKIKVMSGLILSGGSEEEKLLSASPVVLVAAGNPWCSTFSTVPASSSQMSLPHLYLTVLVLILLFLMKTPVIPFGTNPKARMIWSQDP